MPAYRRRIRSARRKTLLADRTATRRIMREAVTDFAEKKIKREFEGFVADWTPKNRPKFTKEITVKPDRIAVVVRPYKRRKASRVFHWTDKGTRPHAIRPKKSNKRGLLFFRTQYQPRTLPVARAQAGPGKAVGPWTAAKAVRHPGTKARLFSETVHKRTNSTFRKVVDNAFRRMARHASGKR